MEKNNITYLFENVSLYEDKKFNLYANIDETFSYIDKDNLNEIIKYLGLSNNGKLISDCIWCDGHFPFNLEIETRNFYQSTDRLYLGRDASFIQDFFDFKSPEILNHRILNSSIEDQIITIDYHFVCTNNQYHEYCMKILLIKVENQIIIKKIGQYPENIALGRYDSETYNKILREFDDSYVDYQNSEKSYRRGLYVGAIEYLRRVFEKMIKFYLSKNSIVIDKKANMKDKIKTVKEYFDDQIQESLYPLYSALSAGVHTMPEEDCKKHYDHLKVIIDIQLQHIKSQEELNDKINKSKQSLDDIKVKYPRQ